MILSRPLSTTSERQTSWHAAENFALQSFVNCYLREVDSGKWLNHHDFQRQHNIRENRNANHVVEVQLQSTSLLFEINYRSLVGRHSICAVYQKNRTTTTLQRIPPYAAILILIRSIYAKAYETQSQVSTQELELCNRLADSIQLTASYLKQRHDDPSLAQNHFIEAEQSLLFGHWLHPTPKSRQGMSFWQQSTYAPELKGHFQLHYFAVQKDHIYQDSALPETAAESVRKGSPQQLHKQCKDNEVLLPQHPLQAQWLLTLPRVKAALQSGWLRDLGCHGEHWTATSSVRTLYRPGFEHMYKFSIPVKITNSLRRNRTHELPVGVVMARLISRLDFFEQFPFFHIVDDPAYLNVRFPNQEESEESGFELILRKNIFAAPQAQGAVLIAALTQDPLQLSEETTRSRLHSILYDLSALEGRNISCVAKDWFQQYWQCAVEPLLYFYDHHGIALEAHQQNSLLNVSNGYPTDYYYRDNQGFYLSPEYRADLLKHEPGIQALEDLFYDESMIQNRFAYYLLINQLFSIIQRLGADELCDEAELIQSCRNWLESLAADMTGAGKRLIQHILNADDLAFKANLLTRIHDVDELEAEQELAVYAKLPNPFKAANHIDTPRDKIGTNQRKVSQHV